MAYTVTPLEAGSSAKQWRVVKGADADSTLAIAHGLGVTPKMLPIVTIEAVDEASLDAAVLAAPGIVSADGTNIAILMRTDVGSIGARAIVTIPLPIQ